MNRPVLAAIWQGHGEKCIHGAFTRCRLLQPVVVAWLALPRGVKPGGEGEDFLVQVLFNGMLENNCSEQASRMAAMEASSKNAKEMLSKLTLSYNR